MARKKDSPQKAALRELMGNYLKENNVKVKDGTDVNSIMRDMMSIILEGALDQELDEELGYSKYDYRNKETDNSRNGHSQKTLHTSYGDMEIDIPRDRKGDFEPQVVKKYQNSITQDMEEKIISMYAKGMTTADIESHMRELYDLEISDSTVSRITDKILPIVKEWQERPLESVYAVVFMDAIHFHARNEGRIVKRAVYIAIGIDMEGRKDVLGMYVGQNESAKFWLSILNGLKNRGVEDILIACVDGLTGFPQAIEAVFPQTEIQQCIIHQIRNTTKFVSYKEKQQTPNTSTDSPTVPFSDTSAIPAPFIFIKSDLGLVIDLQTCIKAQQSESYAQKVKLTNLKQMAQTVAYIQEHGYDSLDDFHATLDQASDQTSASRKSLKDTEQQLKDMNEQIHFTGQYLAYKNVYADYRKSRNKEKFYEEHQAELSLYDTALRTLKEKSGGNKLPSMKALYAEKDRLVELRNRQREDFFNHRDYERELRTVSANIDMILKKNYEQLHDRKEPNL